MASSRVQQLTQHIVPLTTIRVEEFHYTMNGVHTGNLFLYHDVQKVVIWRSARTGLTTPWHGRWERVGNYLMVEFHFLGRNRNRRTVLNGEDGFDYRNRRIHAVLIRTWYLDSASQVYLLGQPALGS